MKLDLSDVTICAVDSVNVELAARAINISVDQCKFADAILFSHASAEGSFRAVKVDKVNSTIDYANVIYKFLPTVVETPFVLIVQWDGYVVDAGAWQPNFRDYDYIGAKWPWFTDGMAVGNGGFSLRSRKFMAAVMEPRFPLNDAADTLICRTYRPSLERDYGVRFAPESVADLFSYETTPPSEYAKLWPPTFGFHGLGNMWRHVQDADLVKLTDHLAPYVLSSGHYARLVVSCFLRGKFELSAALYTKMRAYIGPDGAARAIRGVAPKPSSAQRCIAVCERVSGFDGPARWLAVKAAEAQRGYSLRVAHIRGRGSSFE